MSLADDLKAIDERERAASPGPWECKPRHVKFWNDSGLKSDQHKAYIAEPHDEWLGAELNGPMAAPGRGDYSVPDAYFISASRTDIPVLVEMVKMLGRFYLDELARNNNPPGTAEAMIDALWHEAKRRAGVL